MEEPFLVIEKGPGHTGKFFCIHTVCQREGQFTAFNHLLGIFQVIRRARDEPYLFLLKFTDFCLEISQLLMAEGSPPAPVYQQYGPLSGSYFRQHNGSAVCEFKFHFRELGAAVEFLSFNLSHCLLLMKRALDRSCPVVTFCTANHGGDIR